MYSSKTWPAEQKNVFSQHHQLAVLFPTALDWWPFLPFILENESYDKLSHPPFSQWLTSPTTDASLLFQSRTLQHSLSMLST